MTLEKHTINQLRDSAGSITISEKNENGQNPIENLIVVRNQMIAFKRHSIFHVLLADEIDPERTNKSIHNSYRKIFNSGSESPIVYRTLFQTKRLLEFFSCTDADKNKLLLVAYDFMEEVLGLEAILLNWENSFNQLNEECNDPVSVLQNGFPQHPNLNKEVKEFLSTSRRSLILLCSMFETFFNMPEFGTKYHKIFDHLNENVGSESQLVSFFDEHQKWMHLITEMRNAIEHPKLHQKIYIQNFAKKPDNKFSPPSWKYTLKDYKKDDFSDLFIDCNEIISKLLDLFESFLILSFDEQWQDEAFTIYQLKDELKNEFRRYNYDVTFKP